jgi:transcriptional regulator with XRE-family HTH domain
MLGLFFLYTMKRKAKKPLITKEQALKQLGQRIKNLRMERGFTSYEYFAYENNISRAQYGRYEKGEDLRFSSLVKVISALDMSIPEFFKEGFD